MRLKEVLGLFFFPLFFFSHCKNGAGLMTWRSTGDEDLHNLFFADRSQQVRAGRWWPRQWFGIRKSVVGDEWGEFGMCLREVT
ncbi:hypothetical protein BKA81DRAFT_136208 [Phyllosticta paracitricarpa]